MIRVGKVCSLMKVPTGIVGYGYALARPYGRQELKACLHTNDGSRSESMTSGLRFLEAGRVRVITILTEHAHDYVSPKTMIYIIIIII